MKSTENSGLNFEQISELQSISFLCEIGASYYSLFQNQNTLFADIYRNLITKWFHFQVDRDTSFLMLLSNIIFMLSYLILSSYMLRLFRCYVAKYMISSLVILALRLIGLLV